MQQKNKWKKTYFPMLVCMVLCAFLIGCGRQASQTSQQSTTAQKSIDSQSGGIQTGQAGNSEPQGASSEAADGARQVADDEEYVYDYQVSMEPIPKEIADLGNPCQGTIHAFPSKIRIGLTEKMMEEDPELKAEVEKRIPEIEQELADKIGGEFKVEGVDATDEWEWKVLCAELSTNEEFYITYFNSQYLHRSDGTYNYKKNMLVIEEYDDKKRTDGMKEEIVPMCEYAFADGYSNVWYTDDNFVYICIAEFVDGEVDRIEEQKKIEALWQLLQDYSSDNLYHIKLNIFSPDYKELILQKYTSAEMEDWISVNPEDVIRKLIQNDEIKDSFWYDPFYDDLNKYIKTENNKEWPLWIKK